MHWILALIVVFSGPFKRTDYVTASQFAKARKVVLKAHVRPNGTWLDMYTGRVVRVDDSLDIDHIVPLKFAHNAGLADRAPEEKRRFAVDTLNLVQTGRHENRSKGDDGPSGYLPKVNRCFYVRRWDSVVAWYRLQLPAKDSTALAAIRRRCR